MMASEALAQMHVVRRTCRSCESPDLQEVLSYGEMPLADTLLSPAQLLDHEARHALDLVLCANCSLLQITETVSRSVFYDESFHHYSSDSAAAVEAAGLQVEHLVQSRGLTRDSLVLELGSNDGYLLRHFRQHNVPVLGIDPAPGPAQAARRAGIPTLPTFFTRDLGRQLYQDGRHADVIIANNVLGRVADLHGFVAGIRSLLKEDGLLSIETPYASSMLDTCAFDAVDHERLCYFTANSLERLLRSEDLYVNEIEYVAANGGALRVTASREDLSRTSALRFFSHENAAGLGEHEAYAEFADRAQDVRDRLETLVSQLKTDGVRIAGYGATAAGCTLLNYTGVNGRYLDYVVDPDTSKQQRYVPGVHLAVLRPERLLEDRPDYVLLLDRDDCEGALERLAAYRERGGRVILPAPFPTIV